MNEKKIKSNNENLLLVKRIGLIGLTNFLLSFSGIILLPILTKTLSIEEYGYWVQIGVTVGIVTVLAMLGLPFTLVRFLAPLHKKEEILEIFYSIYVIQILISILVSSIFFIFSKEIASILFEGNSLIVEIMALIVFFECCSSFLIGYLRAREQIKKYSILNLIKTILQITLISYLVLSGKGIIGAEIGLLCSSVSVFLVLNYIIISEIGVKIPRFKNIKEYLNFGIPTIPGNLSNWIVNASDRYVINYYLGPASVGYYSPGYSLGSILDMFSFPLNFILPATLSRYYDNNNIDEVKNILSNSLKYYLLIAVPSFFGISLLSKSLLTTLTTPEIASRGYLVTPFVALSSLFLGIYTILQKIVVLEKKTSIGAKIWLISALINIALNVVLIPSFGIISAAFTTLLAFTVSLILILRSTRSFKIYVDYRSVLKIIVSSLIMSVILVLNNPSTLIEIFFTIIICAIAYFIVLHIFKTFEYEETIIKKKLAIIKKKL
ncbi:lipopolysaccharide biosynthesis protein [Methanosarcina acetivorans]|uniref:Polysaccharide biosynthesis protein n=1 Tax=Methanosarcina acetivorans (strain ATCC 35395 / DSM 2834 / JCM 12185 / C2A) TaxID=188937 RepID=Q8TJL8_METAC|nr:polysaccharide biosynthesis C-terminal domain-containing protein [Methanosarcina acetivorans]AAM07117.1 polysaccharide biosynthesis protein [Methanosarcina acetivorans C2A]